MNDVAFWRVVWKEYRAMRGFWFGMAALALVIQALIAWLARGSPEFAQQLFIGPLAFTTFYALGYYAVIFSSEREDGTIELLRSLAVTNGRLFIGKVGVGFVSMLAMALLVLVSALAWNGGRMPADPVVGELLLYWGVVTFEFAAWGILASLLITRPLNAICIASAGALICTLLVSWQVEKRMHWQHTTAIAISVRLFLVVGLLLVDAWLTRKWLAGRFVLWPAFWERLSWRQAAAIRVRRETRPATRRLVARYLWLEIRQGRMMTIVIFLLGASLSLPESEYWPFFAVGLIPMLLGVAAFRGEQEGQRFRFLAERGVSPAALWMVKQSAWLATAFLATFLAGWAAPIARLIWQHETISLASSVWFTLPWDRAPYDEFGAQSFALVLVTGFAIGQFMSLLLARTITALFVASVVGTGAFFWLVVMIAFGVPLWFSVGPIPIAFLLASLIRVDDWMHERRHIAASLRVACALLAPLCLIPPAVAAFRVYEIPGGGPGFEVDDLLQTTAYELETADIYRKALRTMTPLTVPKYEIPEFAKSAKDGWQHAIHDEKRWLAVNTEAVHISSDASKRGDDECVFYHPAIRRLGDSEEDVQRARHLATLLLLSARKLESENRLDEALERYIAVKRLSRHVARKPTLFQWLIGSSIEGKVAEWIPAWAAHPKQTKERIKNAIKLIGDDDGDARNLADALRCEYLLLRRLIESYWSDSATSVAPIQFAHQLSSNLALMQGWMPWEKARAQRLLNISMRATMSDLDWMRRAVREGSLDLHWHRAVADERRIIHLESFGRLMTNTPVVGMMIPAMDRASHSYADRVTEQRAISLILALHGHRIENGTFPDRLEELAGDYFEKVPIDPWSGEFFGYRPKGFNDEVKFGRPGRLVVPPAKPLIWSVGADGGGLVFENVAHGKAAKSRPFIVNRFHRATYSGQYSDGGGWAFPITP